MPTELQTPSAVARFSVAILIGVLFAVLTWRSFVLRGPGVQGGDFTYPWLAARFILSGQDPYLAIRGAWTPYAPVFLYPLPAALVALPFAWLSATLASGAFIGASCAWLAYVVTREGFWRLIMFASGPAFVAAWAAQWSPFMVACALTVPALALLTAKPNVGLPLLAFQSKMRAVQWTIVGGIVLVAVSLAIQPAWPLHWIRELRQDPFGAQYRAPIVTPLGGAMALALLRWRRSEARLLLTMACLPQTGFLYDQFPLLLVPNSRRELLVAATLSVGALVVRAFAPVHARTIPTRSAELMPIVIVGIYLPALLMVLRRKNEGRAPAWLERLVRRAPAWLRGRSPEVA